MRNERNELILKKSIAYCFNQNKVVSLYCDRENIEKHLTGYICSYNEDEILISHITPSGYYDGFILKHIKDIFRIDYDGEYERKIEKLYNLKEQSHYKISIYSESILYPILEYAKENSHIVCLELQNNNISGFVNEISDFIHLKVIDDYGLENGISVIDIDEVITISVDTEDEQDLKLIME